MQPASPDLPGRFAMMIAGLCQAVAAHIAADRTAGPWIVLVWNRLQRLARRVERLAAQARAGTVPQPRVRFKRTKPRKPATRPPILFGGKPGWLVLRIPQAAAYAGSLRQILDDPELVALLAAAPQLARILRPLCRALGAPPPPRPTPRDPPPAPEPEPAVVVASPQPHRRPASRSRPSRALCPSSSVGPSLKTA